MMHDTQEMLWNGTYYRTAPLARAEYVTTATSVTITHWNNVYEAQVSAANIAVFADGVLVQSFHAPSMGLHTNVVALPAGEKVVEVVTGGMRGPGNDGSDLPTFVGRGIFLSGLEFNAPAQQTPHKEGGLVILTDSIGNGSTLAHPAVESYPALLRRMVDYPVRVLGRGGMALGDVTNSVGTQPAFFATKVAREIARTKPEIVLVTLGYNDANKGMENDFRARLENEITNLQGLLPEIRVFVTQMTPAVTPPAQYHIVNYALVPNAFSPSASRSRVNWGSGVITTDHLNDNVHPNAEGHSLMANYLASALPSLANEPLVHLTDAETAHRGGQNQALVMFRNDGALILEGTSFLGPTVPGQWFIDGPTPGIYEDYQIRVTPQTGSAPQVHNSNYDLTPHVWTDIFNSTNSGSRLFWGSGTAGRALVEIRDKATQEVVAAARYWTPGYAP